MMMCIQWASLPSHSPKKWRDLVSFRCTWHQSYRWPSQLSLCTYSVDTPDGKGVKKAPGNLVEKASSDRYIVNLCNQGHLKQALSMLTQDGVNVGHSALVCLIQSCSSMLSIREGMYLHYYLVCGFLFFDEDIFLENMIMRMYDKCGSLVDAKGSFDVMKRRNIVSWNMIMGAYSTRGHRKEAFRLISRMLLENSVKPDKVTFIIVLGVCDNISPVSDVRMLHGSIIETGIEGDVTIGNVLINVYSRLHVLEDSCGIFNRMPSRNIITWNTLISAHAMIPGHEHVSLQLFRMMHFEDIARDKATFMSSLNGCVNRKVLVEGRLIHFEISQDRLESDLMIGTALIKMYGRCESLADACCIFESMMPKTDVILWTTMIAAYIQQGHNKEALQFYYRMKHEGVKPNKITLVTILNACTKLGLYIEGKTIHDCIPEKEVISDIILSNALITMYQKCGSFIDAEKLFVRMPKKDVVSCTAMIASYAEQGRGFDALFLFERMLQMGVSPDKFTFSSVLDACASISALSDGRILYALVIESGVDCDRVLRNSLISMYGECGIMQDAYNMFTKLKDPDNISWSAIIGAYANHGSCEDVLRLFQGLQEQGLEPSKITYISVLCACSHAGAINTGYTYFASMIAGGQSILPTYEHYMCMIDLVGRAGCVEEAEQIVIEMPLQPDAILWNTLLGACRVHQIADKGKLAADHVLELDKENEVAHVVLANLYASSGRWDEALMVKKAMMVATKKPL